MPLGVVEVSRLATPDALALLLVLAGAMAFLRDSAAWLVGAARLLAPPDQLPDPAS